MSKKIGVSLTGGGARGGYQIGALKALRDLGILEKVQCYAGTSIGAANVAVAASRGVEAAEAVWRNLPEDNIPKKDKVSDTRPRFKINLPDLKEGMYSMDVFERVMSESIDYDAMKTKEVYVTVSRGGQSDQSFLSIFRSTYSHYVRRDSQVDYMPLHKLSSKMIIQSVVASCSVPVFFSPVTINDTQFYDGGVFDNVPVTPLVEAGCDEIIIIYLHRNGKRFTNPSKIFENVKFHEIKHTGRNLGRVLKFSKEQTDRLIALGYEETMHYFETLQESEPMSVSRSRSNDQSYQ